MGIGKDSFLAVAPSAPPTPSRGIIIIIIIEHYTGASPIYQIQGASSVAKLPARLPSRRGTSNARARTRLTAAISFMAAPLNTNASWIYRCVLAVCMP